MKVEIEIKLRLPGKLGKIRRRLRELGFHTAKPRALESNTLFDNSKIKSVVPGWRAVIPFERGAREIADWYLGDPARPTYEPVVRAAGLEPVYGGGGVSVWRFPA